jgi:type IV secretory pathway VirB10-like protein
LSSILKALKKIDASSLPDDTSPPWPHPGDAGDAITRSIKKRWLIRRMTTYILVAACVISLAVLLYFRQVDSGSRERTAEAQSGAKTRQGQVYRAKIAKTAPPDGPAASKPSPSPPPGTSTPPVTPTLPNPSAPSLQRAPAAPAVGTSRDTARISRTRKALPKKSKKAATKIAPTTGETSARKPPPGADAGKSSVPPPAERSTPSSRRQDTGLVLQAIAWAPEPSRRIAVVNGSIVKEGDSVEGYTLMRIRKDDIVLNDGGKTWQLEFGLQR